MAEVNEKTRLFSLQTKYSSSCSETDQKSDDQILYEKEWWQIWNPLAGGHRFFLLAFVCFVPFGGHFVKNCMSSLEQFMLDDKSLHLTNTMYGALISAVSIPNMLIPFFGGVLLDTRGHMGILVFLLWMVLGQILFVIAMQSKSFSLALVGRIVFGFGEGSVVVGTRTVVSHWFDNYELTFAMGATVAITNISKMMAKASVAPIAIYFGGYIYALWYGVLICLGSFLMGIIVCFLIKRLKNVLKRQDHIDPRLTWLNHYSKMIVKRKERKTTKHLSCRKADCSSLHGFSSTFWLLTLLHVVFINVFHLFQNVSSSYLYQKYGYSLVKAGFISSLSHILVAFAPFFGLLVDYLGGKMYIMAASALISILAYVLMIFSLTDPIVSMVLMSLCLAVTPTILMSSIPMSVSKSSYGVAFGIVEITDAIGAFFGNVLIGYLRDKTGSYTADMYVLLGMACFCLMLSLILVLEGIQNNGKLNSAPRSGRLFSVDDDDPCVDMAEDLCNDTSSGSEA